MLLMIVERFKGGDPVPVYRRFRDRGRLAPPDLIYMASWVTEGLTTCYQLMECSRPDALEEWMASWRDLVDFEVHAVLTSEEARTIVAPRL
ncbi:MAG TPA: DUF3303 family protein [Gemmatimonadales bacterium]|nr:DUF3303 family protein [Gemmatimonadales bacterium]